MDIDNKDVFTNHPVIKAFLKKDADVVIEVLNSPFEDLEKINIMIEEILGDKAPINKVNLLISECINLIKDKQKLIDNKQKLIDTIELTVNAINEVINLLKNKLNNAWNSFLDYANENYFTKNNVLKMDVEDHNKTKELWDSLKKCAKITGDDKVILSVDNASKELEKIISAQEEDDDDNPNILSTQIETARYEFDVINKNIVEFVKPALVASDISQALPPQPPQSEANKDWAKALKFFDAKNQSSDDKSSLLPVSVDNLKTMWKYYLKCNVIKNIINNIPDIKSYNTTNNEMISTLNNDKEISDKDNVAALLLNQIKNMNEDIKKKLMTH